MRAHVPKQWDDVTPDWMTAVIAPHHPGAEVGEVAVVLLHGDAHIGNTCLPPER